jgi:prepilin-type N-terminal cleavage/methylation domain-containing protein
VLQHWGVFFATWSFGGGTGIAAIHARFQQAIGEHVRHYIILFNRLLVVHAASKHMKSTRTKKGSIVRVGLGGFTLVEILIVIAIIGLLCAIAIPNYVKARANSQASACINNLRQIDSAVQQFAIENQKAVGAMVIYPNDLTPYIRLNSASLIPACPASGTYTVSPVGSEPSVLCSLGTTVSPPHTY